MAIVNTLKIYEILKQKLDEEPAKAITEVIETSFEEYKKEQKEFLVTREEFKETIANLRADLIRWMFIFWVGQVGVIVGILLAFFKR